MQLERTEVIETIEGIGPSMEIYRSVKLPLECPPRFCSASSVLNPLQLELDLAEASPALTDSHSSSMISHFPAHLQFPSINLHRQPICFTYVNIDHYEERAQRFD